MTELDRWGSGVGGMQCGDCGRTTVCRAFYGDPSDPLDEEPYWLCLPCWRGDDDEYGDQP